MATLLADFFLPFWRFPCTKRKIVNGFAWCRRSAQALLAFLHSCHRAESEVPAQHRARGWRKKEVATQQLHSASSSDPASHHGSTLLCSLVQIKQNLSQKTKKIFTSLALAQTQLSVLLHTSNVSPSHPPDRNLARVKTPRCILAGKPSWQGGSCLLEERGWLLMFGIHSSHSFSHSEQQPACKSWPCTHLISAWKADM